jgi:hypothetical protein
MKWNWGTKLILVFGFFIAAMTALVIMSMRQKIQMVAKDYYNDELKYQQVINATELANQLSTPVELIKQDGYIILQLPAEMKGEVIKGTILFYYPADAVKDRELPLQTNTDAQQLVPLSLFLPGNYTVKIAWIHKDKQYYAEQSLSL